MDSWAFNEPEITRSIKNGILDLARIADDDVEPHLGELLMIGREAAWQPIVRDCLTSGDRHTASWPTRYVAEDGACCRYSTKHGVCFRQKKPARVSQTNPTPDAVEQSGAILPFQGRDRCGGCRLRDAEFPGRTGDMLAFGDGDKNAQLFG